MGKIIYLDNSATTKPYDEVVEYMAHILRNVFGNPSSLHTLGIEAEKAVKKARESVSAVLGAKPSEILFTSGGTESNNTAILGYLEANPRKGNEIITTAVEHPSVLEVYKSLASKGYKTKFINVDSKGLIKLDELYDAINENTALISIILVNNEVGTIQPVDEIAAIKNSKNSSAVLHVDAVQAYGKLKINPVKSGIGLISISSHKIHGPKGAGALYVGKGIRIKPLLLGGGQEGTLRSGTENVPAICGFGLASEMVLKAFDENNNKVRAIREKFISLLNENITGFKINSPEDGLPHIVNISFPNVRSEVLLHHLEQRNIFVSTGSACSSRKNIHSHVLKAMGLKACDIEGAIRFSFSHFNSYEDIEETVSALKDILPAISTKR